LGLLGLAALVKRYAQSASDDRRRRGAPGPVGVGKPLAYAVARGQQKYTETGFVDPMLTSFPWSRSETGETTIVRCSQPPAVMSTDPIR
jgi:hypothetical protein